MQTLVSLQRVSSRIMQEGTSMLTRDIQVMHCRMVTDTEADLAT